MKLIVAYLGDVLNCPPAMSLINSLNDLEQECVFICYEEKKAQFKEFINRNKNVKFAYIGKSNTKNSFIKKTYLFFKYKRMLKRIIKKEYSSNSVIWVLSNGTLKYFNKYIVKLNYVLHLLELTEKLYLVESKHLLPLSNKYSDNALFIVECEYNRAHITKAWWNLKKMPLVLQNKPYNDIICERNQEITISEINNLFRDKLIGKKIILYQGNISKERPLDAFIDAVSELGDDYAFVAMTNGKVDYSGNSKNFYQITFVAPPKHLEITSRAYIGILSYTPVKNSYSILNTLYCAPNKIWEYSMFSVPMIGNDLPALRSHFVEYKDGVCVASFSKEIIKDAILKIDSNYNAYSSAAKSFFDSYDYKLEVKKILDECSSVER